MLQVTSIQFDQLVNGTKTIHAMLATGEALNVNPGDLVDITENDRKLIMRVVRKTFYLTCYSLLCNEGLRNVCPDTQCVATAVKLMQWRWARSDDFGMYAFELARI